MMQKTKIAALAASLLLSASAFAVDITGAGATFPAPIYGKWADAYQKATGTKVNYQSIGSGGGIKQITAKTVDFGASDMPLKPEVLNKDGMMQFPAVIGGVVPVVNLPGIQPGQIKMTGEVLADIFLGKITKWDDKAIVALNPGIKFPNQDILAVHRSDGSGTSFVFTNYLSKVSADWKTKVGEGTAVQWPNGVGGKGNEGVSAFVQRLGGAIGYVEYAYAIQNKMKHVSLKNAAGNYVQPNDDSFKAAAADADWSKSAFYQILTEQKGKTAWPITGATFIIMHKVQADPVKGAEVLKFFEWAYKNGDKMAADLDYVPLPDSLIKLIGSSWNVIKDGSGKVVYSAK